MLATVLGLLIAAGIGAYIFLPYLLGWDEETKGELLLTEDPREELMIQLADLEYDFRAGKLAEEDYRKLRREIEAQLLRLEPKLEPELEGESEEAHGDTEGRTATGAGPGGQDDRGA